MEIFLLFSITYENTHIHVHDEDDDDDDGQKGKKMK
jgi:hypothetical protein